MRQTNGLSPLIRRAMALALAASGVAIATQPAGAQVFFDYYAGPIRPLPPPYPPPYYPAPPVYPGPAPVLSPRDVVEAVRDQGYEPTSRPVRNRNVYALDARDPAGRGVRLIVEAFEGEILQAIPASAPRAPDLLPADPDEPRVIPAPVPQRPAARPQSRKPAPGAAPPASDALKMEPRAPAPAPSVGSAPAGPAPVVPLDAPPATPPAPAVPVAPLD